MWSIGGKTLADRFQDFQSEVTPKSWYPTYLNYWNQGGSALAQAMRSGVFNQFPDFDARSSELVSGGLRGLQDTTSNFFGSNLDSSTVEHIGDFAAPLAKAGMIAGGAYAGAGALAGAGEAAGGMTTADAATLGGMTEGVGTGSAVAGGGTGGALSGEASGGGSMWDWLDNLDTGSFDPGGEGMYQAPSPDFGSFDPGGEGLYNDPNYGGMDFGSFDPGGEGVFTGNGSVFNGQNPLWGQLAKYGSKLLNPLLAAAGGRAGAGGSRPGGGMSMGDMAFNSTPFLLSAALANSQRNDINPYLDRLNSLSDRFAGNESPYLKSLTDPYDMSTNRGRGDLTMRLGDRGVLGSSFGNADLGNFDYMRDVGRGNLVSQAINQSVGAQSQLTDQAIKGVNTRNAGTNALLGAGLNASSRLFSPQQDPFGIQQILKMAGANG